MFERFIHLFIAMTLVAIVGGLIGIFLSLAVQFPPLIFAIIMLIIIL